MTPRPSLFAPKTLGHGSPLSSFHGVQFGRAACGRILAGGRAAARQARAFEVQLEDGFDHAVAVVDDISTGRIR